MRAEWSLLIMSIGPIILGIINGITGIKWQGSEGFAVFIFCPIMIFFIVSVITMLMKGTL